MNSTELQKKAKELALREKNIQNALVKAQRIVGLTRWDGKKNVTDEKSSLGAWKLIGIAIVKSEENLKELLELAGVKKRQLK